jgi:hypothetical protein
MTFIRKFITILFWILTFLSIGTSFYFMNMPKDYNHYDSIIFVTFVLFFTGVFNLMFLIINLSEVKK